MFKGWRTMAFNGAVFILAILAMPEVQGLIPAEALPIVIAVVAVANMALRKATTTAVGRRA